MQARRSLKHQRFQRVRDRAYNIESCAGNIQTSKSSRAAMIVYITVQLSLPNRRLPANEQVLFYYFSLSMDNFVLSVPENVCPDVMLHWISCNVYTLAKNCCKLDELIKSYRDLKFQQDKKRCRV